MFTMAKIRDGSTYLGTHLTANDYYCENESVVGQWTGLGAERLDLRGEIRAGDKAFEALRRNRHPDGSGKLTPRDSKTRVRLFDFQCSAQKSVSIMAVTFGDTRLLKAHDAAAKLAFGELEKFAARQANTLLTRADVRTGNVVAASFRHTASRSLDPQVHTHFVAANATWDEKAKGWRALTEYQMVKAVRYAGKVYQNELARSCRSLGYEIIYNRDTRGFVTGFELDGVPAEVCKRFSKRRAEIEQGITHFREDHGREPTAAEVHMITVMTRVEKLSEVTTSEVLAAQRRQLSTDELSRLEQLKAEAVSLARTREVGGGLEQESVGFAIAHLYERRSVVLGHEVLAEALNQHLGHQDLSRLHRETTQAGLVGLTGEPWLHEHFATREGLEAEQWAVEFVARTRGLFGPLGREPSDLSAKLSVEQREAATKVLASRDQVVCFRGAAGVGKTTVLAEVWNAIGGTGVPLLGCAPTSSATDTLRRDGLTATTVSDLLDNVARMEPKRLQGAVLMVDESSLASNRQGAELLDLAERYSARLIFVGDTKQHTSVEAGDFLRILETHSKIHRVELTSIRRQEYRAYRDAVVCLSTGSARLGLERLDDLGWVKEGKANYLQNAVADYVKLHGRGKKTPDVLVVTPSWEEHDVFTRALRARLKEKGILGPEHPVTVCESLRWTRAMTADPRNYEPSMIVSFHRSVGGFAAGHSYRVSRTDERGVWVESPACERPLPPDMRGFTVYRSRALQVAPRDKLLVRANDRVSGLLNGERLTVEKIEAGLIRFTDGRTFDTRRYGHFLHGYAVTSHISQSKTVDHVIVAASRLDAKSAYVACSRGRFSCTVNTPDKEALFAQISKGDRPAALDLLRSKEAPRKPALDRTAIWSRMKEHARVAQQFAAKAVGQEISRLREMARRACRGPLSLGLGGHFPERAHLARENDEVSR